MRKMGADKFCFKQFAITQVNSAMKVGTDGVLLGAWVNITGTEQTILDIGTGTGLIALMMAQRNPSAHIDAVEIEPGAATEAKANADISPWKERVNVYCESFQNFAARSEQKYDLIVSNPPYFNGTYKSIQAERTAARHVGLLKNDDIIEGVVKIIHPQTGRFAAIFPYETGAVFIAKATALGLYCTRMVNIYPKSGRHIKRIAAEFSMTRTVAIEENLVIESENGYATHYKELTKDFYLRF